MDNIWAIILSVAGGVSTIIVAVTHAVKVWRGIIDATKKPWERVHMRLDDLENGVKEDHALLEMLLKKQDKNDQTTARLELMNLILHYPENNIAIERAYDKYIENGWNSYIHDLVDDWRRQDDTSVRTPGHRN